MNDTRPIRRTALGWLLVATAAGGLLLGARSYLEASREARADEYKLQVLGRLADVIQLNFAINQIGAGESNAARLTLAMQLRSGLREVREALTAADPTTREYGEWVCERIANPQNADRELHITYLKSRSSIDSKLSRQRGAANRNAEPPNN